MQQALLAGAHDATIDAAFMVELLKILLVVYLATYRDERRHLIGASYYLKGVRLPPLPYLVPIVLMWGLAIGLIIIQKDLGAALLFFTIFLAIGLPDHLSVTDQAIR